MSQRHDMPAYAGQILSCFGKQAFATASEAIKALRNAPKRRSQGRKLVHYRCAYCHQFHIGGNVK